MTWLPPLLVAIPLLTAALIAAGDHMVPEAIEQAAAIAATAVTAALAIVLALEARRHTVVTWFGGWRPRHGIALGVDFTADQLAAGMCVVIALVVLLALVYSLTYMKEAARLYEALMLAALGAMCGFAMAGDLFNLFVWLELAAVAGYALTGFAVEQLGPTQGAINFAIVTSVGSYLFAIGIALLYARTGALNLAQVGGTLAGQHPGGLEIVALTLVVAGLLTKAACFPFHFWAADAYAAAPAPVCAMFGAVMTDLGLIGLARLYWTVFDAPFGAHGHAVGDLLLWVGIVTALLGGVMALLQRHLKRMLAYSVVSHIGTMLAGVGLLSSKGLAGTATLFVSHAFLTAGLFLICGILLAVHGSIDELVLARRRSVQSPALGALWAAAAVGLVGAPYVGVYLGHGLLDEAASGSGRPWVPPLLWLASALVAGALLRAGARTFLGLGSLGSPLLGKELPEEPIVRDVRRPLLAGTALVAIVLGLAVSVAPGLGPRAEAASGRFRDRAAYASLVLHGVPPRPTRALPYTLEHTTLATLLYGGGALLAAVALAGAGLYWRALPPRLRAPGRPVLARPVAVLKAFHSGVVGDYVLWLVVGTAVFGGVWALTLR